MANITNRESLEAWLNDRPHEDAVLIAARAALRAAPLLHRVLGEERSERRATIVLPVFRAMVITRVAGTWPTRSRAVQDDKAYIEAAFAVESAASAAADAISAYTNSRAARINHAARAVADAVKAVADHSVHRAAEAVVSSSHAIASYCASLAIVGNGSTSEAALRAGREAQTIASLSAWGAVQHDASALERGVSHMDVSRTQLWPAGTPKEMEEAWVELKVRLLRADEQWDVWTKWYDDILAGLTPDEDLELSKCLIPDEVWKAGPATLNAEIARLISEHEGASLSSSPDEPVSDGYEIVKQLAATEAFADSDFQYDPDTDSMDAVPFQSDITPIEDDPFRMRERADLLSSIADLAKNLFQDIKTDQPQVPGSLRRDLDRYAREADKAPQDVRPRHLRSIAVALQAALSDEDIRLGLGNYLLAKLEELIVQHNALIAGYFSAVAEHGAAARDKALPEDATPETLDSHLGAARDLIADPAWAALPEPPDGYPEHLEMQQDALREMAGRLDLKPEGEARAKLLAEIEHYYLVELSTVSRLIDRTVEAAASKQGAAAANIVTISTGAVALVGMILTALGLL